MRFTSLPFRDFLFINHCRARSTHSGIFRLCGQYLAQAAPKAPSIERKKIHLAHVWRCYCEFRTITE